MEQDDDEKWITKAPDCAAIVDKFCIFMMEGGKLVKVK